MQAPFLRHFITATNNRITVPNISRTPSTAEGLFVLLGWGEKNPWIKSIHPGPVGMKDHLSLSKLVSCKALAKLMARLPRGKGAGNG